MSKKRDDIKTLLLTALAEGFERRAWHGPNLRGSIRGLDAKRAAWRPNPKRHSIWEIVLHAAYWKYAVRRRLTGEKRGSFPLQGSNWFPMPERIDEDAWRSAVRLLVDQHLRLTHAVSALQARAFGARPDGGQYSAVRLVSGIAAHDVYHAGQIQLLKRLGAH